MTVEVEIRIRDPFPPHRTLAIVEAGEEFRYGFLIGGPSEVAFAVERSDPNAAANFRMGNMITFERPKDGAHPWVGYITRARHRLSAPVSWLECRDLLGSLYRRARTPKGWGELRMAAGDWIRSVFADADRRGDPPLLTRQPSSFGPQIAYTPAAESIADFLETMAAGANWEYGIRHDVSSPEVISQLLWQPRLGRDMSTAGGVRFEEGVHFTDAEYVEDVDGFLKSAVAIGGTGAIEARPAALASDTGADDVGISGTPFATSAQRSPILQGTRVVTEPQISNVDALVNVARRQHETPEFIGEALSFQMHESADADGLEAVDVSKIELGSVYEARFSDLAMGATLERRVRLLGYSIGTDGEIDCVGRILGEVGDGYAD